MRQVVRVASMVAGLSLVLAACGSSGGDAPSAPAGGSAPGAPSPSAAPPSAGSSSAPAASPSQAPDAGSLNTAVVVVGDQRYEFTGVQCSIFAPRYIQAGNFGGDPEVSIVLPPEGWETQGDTFSPPSVTIKIGDEGTGERWVAGDDGYPLLQPLPDGSSQIDSYTVPDGRPVTATGTATFIDVEAHNSGADAQPVSGSFEVSCP